MAQTASPQPAEPASNAPIAEREGEAPSPDPERRWIAEVYQGGAKQLTIRAIVAGMVIGAVMCLSNLYVVLKTGWSLGVTITACILAYSLFSVLRTLRITK